jgi:hypothetical protein
LPVDRGGVLGADVTLRVDPHGGDAGGAKVIFRELLVASRLVHAFAFVRAILELYRAPNVSCM